MQNKAEPGDAALHAQPPGAWPSVRILQRRLADEIILAEVDHGAEPRRVRAHRRVEVRAGIQQPGLDPPRTTHRDREHAERPARLEQARAHRLSIDVGREVDLPPQLVGEPGPRDDDLLARNSHGSGVEIAKRQGVRPVHRGRQDLERVRALHLADPDVRVDHLDVHASAVRLEPERQVTVRLPVPEPILRQPDEHPVDDHPTIGKAGELIAAPADPASWPRRG